MKTFYYLNKIKIVSLPFYFILLFSIFMSSCSSVKPLSIEVKKPASVTLPIDIAKLLIVNNSITQPRNAGTEQKYNGLLLKESSVDLQSAGAALTSFLLKSIAKANFFNEVAYSRQTFRNDGEWMAIKPIPEEVKTAILDTLAFDAILSLDRLLFSIEEDIKVTGKEKNSHVPHFIHLKVNAKADGNIYLYNKKEPVHSFSVSDSLFIKDTFFEDSITVVKYFPESLVNDLVILLGEKISQTILPSWIKQERFLYVGSDARLKEAYSYIKNDDWDAAKTILLSEYERRNNNSEKGQIANNIAVCYEMQDDVLNALEWAKSALNHFKESKAKSDSQEIKLSENLVKNLTERVKELSALNEQEGV